MMLENTGMVLWPWPLSQLTRGRGKAENHDPTTGVPESRLPGKFSGIVYARGLTQLHGIQL